MITQPFQLLTSYSDRLTVALFTKGDGPQTDASVAEATGISKTAGLWQEHGNRTMVVREPHARTEKADGLLTDTPELLLTIRSADCQSFVAYSPEKHVCGLLHAGWRGVLSNAPQQWIQAFADEWNVDPSTILIGAGPALCTTCSEYKDASHELRQQVNDQYVQNNCVDLRTAATDQLLAVGVQASHIERHPDCTRCHPERYYTYRGGDKELVESGVSNFLVCALH